MLKCILSIYVKNEIVLYQPDNTIQLEVRLLDETVWLSQQQMVALFDSTKPNISMHIRNIYQEGELQKEATVQDFLTVQNEGGRNKGLIYEVQIRN